MQPPPIILQNKRKRWGLHKHGKLEESPEEPDPKPLMSENCPVGASVLGIQKRGSIELALGL